MYRVCVCDRIYSIFPCVCVCVCKTPAHAHCIHKPLSHIPGILLQNRDKVQVFCILHVSCICVCVYSIKYRKRTHGSRLCVCVCMCVIHLVWSGFFPIERLMNGEQEGSTATRTHGNSPSTLSATTPFVRHIYLCVRRRLGKSLTRRPSVLLNAADQRERERDYVCALSIICAFSTLSLAAIDHIIVL